MQAAIRATPNLERDRRGRWRTWSCESGAVAGVVTADGRALRAGAVVLTTGTFLRGLIHLGEEKTPAGRHGEPPAIGLSQRLLALGLRLGRLKTGTPARLDGRTIDWASLEMQAGDDPPIPFSFLTERIDNATDSLRGHHTPPRRPTPIIRDNLAPLAACIPARSSGVGPRYCPSIEDKVVRFADRTATRSSWSPRAWTTTRSIPTASRPRLPADVQEPSCAPFPGSRTPRSCALGYAIEYDYVRPTRARRRRWRRSGCRALPGRPDQRHHRLRGGRRRRALIAGINAALRGARAAAVHASTAPRPTSA